MHQEDPSPERLTSGELRLRAARGAALLGARGAAIYALGIVANVVLARLLTPRDFGIFALGLGVVVLGTYLAEGGLGAALINRERPPRRAELEAIAAAQLAATALVALAAAAVAVPGGRDAEVVALMASSLPVAVLRAPSVIVLERELRYRPIATADVVEALAFYGCALAGVAVGLGVWGMAAAVVVRAAAGSLTVVLAGPVGLVRPRWSWRRVRPLLGFGAMFQAANVIVVAREHVLNLAVGAIAGLGTLGVWALGWRVMRIPALLFQTVGRVAFPVLSRLLAAHRDAAPVLERQVAIVAAASALVVVPLVGLAPALPTLVGSAWHDVPAVLLWSGVAVTIAAPAAATASAYLAAAGEPGRVALSALASTVAWLAVALPLVEPLGAPGVAAGWVAGGVVHAGVLWRAAAARTGARLARGAPVTAVALAAIAVAWLVAHAPADPLLGGAAGAVAGAAVVAAGLLAVARETVVELRALARQALRRGARAEDRVAARS